MKVLNRYILFLSALFVGLTSCDKEDLITYSGADVVNFDYGKMQIKKDSIDIAYGFVMDESKQINLEVLLTGYAQNMDRELNIKVESEEGAEEGVHYTLPDKMVLPANEVMVTVPLTILRPDVLKDKPTSFLVKLENSTDLEAGMYKTLFVSVSDEIPDKWIGDSGWWFGSIDDYFGECSKTKYMFVYQQLGVWDFSAYAIWGGMPDESKFTPAKRIVKEKLAEYEAEHGPLVDPEKGRVTFPE